MLTARLVPVPLLVSAVAAATEMNGREIHGYETGVSVALLLAGIGSAFLLAWRARGEKDSLCQRIGLLEESVRGLACQREKRECGEKRDNGKAESRKDEP